MKLFTYFFIFLIKGLFTLKKLKINSFIDLNDTGVLKSLNYSTLLPLPDQKYFINDDKIFNFDASKLNINFNFYKKQIGYLLENKSKENYISINSENYELI